MNDHASRLRPVPVGIKRQITMGGQLHADSLDRIAGMEGPGRKIVPLRHKEDRTGLVSEYDWDLRRAARSCPERVIRGAPARHRPCGQERCDDHWWHWDPARRVADTA